jgi:hypothetical protein
MGLEEPLMDRKNRPDKQDEPRPRRPQPMTCRTVAIAEWRMAVERALHYRRPRAILIDEAQHMAKMAAGRRLQDQLDCLKSLASLTRTIHVLIGTYELLAFRNLSAPLQPAQFGYSPAPLSRRSTGRRHRLQKYPDDFSEAFTFG